MPTGKIGQNTGITGGLNVPNNEVPAAKTPAWKSGEKAVAGGIDAFRDIAKQMGIAKSKEINTAKNLFTQLPAGIVTKPADVDTLKRGYENLAGLKPVLPGQQNAGDRVLKVLNTDFAQTEIAGLKPSGPVFQVLEGGNTRANFSQFTPTGGGPALNAVEFGKLDVGLNGSKITITGLYGFAAPKVALTPKDYLDITKGIKKSLAVADAITAAAKTGPQVGARDPKTVNSFVTALATQDTAALQQLIPATATAAEKTNILALAASLTAAERAGLTKMGPLMDLNTVTGPVAGTVSNAGIGYQNIGFDDGKNVAFQSGTAKDAYGQSYDTKNLKPGQPGYKYTFYAEVQDISK
jgi:hypothetical protein